MQCETKKFKQNIAEERNPSRPDGTLMIFKDRQKKEGIEIKEKNHTMRDAEASVRSSCGGQSVEAGGRYGLMEASVCEKE